MPLIFLTGAAVLALEVLSSRIMTPYFGVSLYIWSSILSITLTFLALGYWAGGHLTRRLPEERHLAVYLLLPVASAASVLASAAVYPALFPTLARFDLVSGSFVASTLLLALPLICLSAMNPLLISLRARGARIGDGGAGQVFFVSTIGSVAGVVVTAFLIIPNFTNFGALLWLAAALCAVSAGAALAAPALAKPRRWQLVGAAAIVAALCLALIAQQERYLAALTRSADADQRLSLLAEYTSVFGSVKVVELSSAAERYPPIKVLLQEGIIQNRTSLDNTSLSMYTYALDSLSEGFVPEAKRALVLGLGAGIVPRDMTARGLAVTVVDINAGMVRAAVEQFGFDASTVRIVLQDARTYVRGCSGAYDVVIVDLFQGDGTPDYLMTKEFFADLRRCLGAHGALVMNAFFDPDERTANMRLLATVHDAFPRLYLFQAPDLNTFIVGMAGRPPANIDFATERVPPVLQAMVRRSLRSGAPVRAVALLGYAPLTDQQNLFALLAVNAQMQRRREIVRALPARVLVN
jgi:predicted membrane-bound spermidine synthase